MFYVLYIALAVIFLAPLLFLFVSSVKSGTQLVSGYGDAQGVHSLWQPDA